MTYFHFMLFIYLFLCLTSLSLVFSYGSFCLPSYRCFSSSFVGVVVKFYCSLVELWSHLHTMNPHIRRIIACIVNASIVKDAKSSKYVHLRSDAIIWELCSSMILFNFFRCNICGRLLNFGWSLQACFYCLRGMSAYLTILCKRFCSEIRFKMKKSPTSF